MLGPLRGASDFQGLRHCDVAIASGTLSPTKDTKVLELAAIDWAFKDGDLQVLTATAEATLSAVEHLTTIDELLTERVGANAAPNRPHKASYLLDRPRARGESRETL